MDVRIVVFAVVFAIFGIIATIGTYIGDKLDEDWDVDWACNINKIDHNLLKCNEALKDVGTTTEEASSAFSELAKALDSPIITPNEARKLIGMDSQSGISIYEPIDDKYTVEYTGKYRCPACGTMYIHEGGGFIPNCKNCGSQLVEQVMIKRGISRGF